MNILYLSFMQCFILQSVCFMTFVAMECKFGLHNLNVAYTITVSNSRGANFTSIADAIKSIPSGNDQWIKILLDPGTYREKVEIQRDKGCILLEGKDRATTTIIFDAYESTSQSVTFGVYSENFVAKGVTFKNSHNLAQQNQLKGKVVPAVAFASVGDKHAFYSCGFEGYQDTLLDHIGRHYFHSCYIEGAADFIWGNGQSIYEQCTINVTGDGYITAQGRESPNEPSGFLFNRCNIVGKGRVVLGRAYRAFSRVIFNDSYFSNVIKPEGWDLWRGNINGVVFAEVNCTGPGSDTSHRVSWLKKLGSSQIVQFATKAFVDQDGWISKLPV